MNQINLIGVYQNEDMLRRVFSWLARIGAGPKFGSRPIGWYQMHHCAAIDILCGMNLWHPVCKNGVIMGRGIDAEKRITINDLYAKADARSRGTL
jgi:hypothetical protein